MTRRPFGELLDTAASTNDLAKIRGALGPDEAPHGSWISARVQTAGRGRMGRSWHSEVGNLFLSVILRPSETRHWTWIPLLGAVGVVELLSSGRFGSWDPSRFSIKWPNDLWLDGKKLGGILCEAVSSASGHSFVVLGLGLNAVAAPEGLDQPTASLEDSGLSDRLREPLAEWIASAVHRLDREGPGFLSQAYGRWAAFPFGSQIEWSSGGTRHQGVVEGLGASGELLVRVGDGESRALFAEEVSAVRA